MKAPKKPPSGSPDQPENEGKVLRPRSGQERLSQTARVYGEIRRRILHLELLPSATFTEGDIAKDLQVSKTPVREGLLLLAWEGLIIPKAGSGYAVSSIRLKDARHALQLWRLLATEAARLAAARRVRPELVQGLENALEIFKSSETSPGAGWPDAYFQVNNLIALVADNVPMMTVFFRQFFLIERLIRLAHSLAEEPLAVPPSIENVVKAIVAGDPTEASKSIYDHISEVEETILKALVASPAFQDVDLGEILREREERSAMLNEALRQRKADVDAGTDKSKAGEK